MFRILVLVALISCSSLLQAKTTEALYQIDLIVFAHQQDSTLPEDLSFSTAIPPQTPQAIPLDTEINSATTAYHLLPPSSSQLRQEYWALHRKPQYRVLMHYTWLQPFDNQRAIVLPKIDRDGWQVEGTLRIRRSNYYLLNTDLVFSSPNNGQAAFVFSQKQRLKGGDIYYLDHPQAGMLIKIHQLA